MEATHTIQDCKRVFKPVPRLAEGAIKFLDKYLTKKMNVFEWGAGGSTIWIAERVKHIYSVESQEHWVKFLSGVIKEKGLKNITLYYQPTKVSLQLTEFTTLPNDYYNYIEKLKMKFDAIIIDGETYSRNECMKIALPYLAKGGVIVFDNYAHFLFDRARQYIRHWSINNYVRKDHNTTAVIYL